MDMLEKFRSELKKIEEFLKSELSVLRVGRATPALVENIIVDYYGAKTPLRQIASISAPEPKMLVIEPWDKNALSAIEKSILTSNLGLNPIVDKSIIRITIPQLTEERRNSLIKIANAKLEEAKIKIKASRDETMKELNNLFEAKKITEDEKFKIKEKIQSAINEGNADLEKIIKNKEIEIRET